MLSIPLAVQLQAAGLRWTPASGDCFIVLGAGMSHEIFVISDMTVDVHDLPTGRVIGFNGTTEWALDSVEQKNTVWLPRETQLRDLLGATLRSLEREADGWSVSIEVGATWQKFTTRDAEDAYATALLYLITGERNGSFGGVG